MINKTRKHISPVALLAALGVVAVLAVMAAVVWLPSSAQAQSGPSNPFAPATTTPTPGGPSNPFAPEPEPNKPPVAMAGVLSDVELLISTTSDPINVSTAFEDPDGDTLTYTVESDRPNIVAVTIIDGVVTIVTGSNRGTADITVTADDGKGGTDSVTFTVTVTEVYTLTAVPSVPGAPGTYLVAGLGPYTAKFNLGVAGSEDDVTVTVTASPNDGITIEDSDGLIGAGFKDDEERDLEGSLTVKSTDAGSRAFEIEGNCLVVGAMADIVVEDKDLDVVAEGIVLCKEPDEPPPPEAGEFRSDMMTVVSYNDWDHHTVVTDGFIIDDSEKNVEHMLTQDPKYNQMGVLVRDEPVVESYQLAISEMENLGLLPGNAPRRTKVQAEEGQHTIEVQVGMSDVQLTVTSMLKSPAYIRFLDSDMQPFGTDVDEEPMWRGADVVGLDSQGRLDLNLTPVLSKAKALAYDQYRVVIPGLATGNAYLDGVAGSYYQGAFRFFNPCPSEDHHFYVEVYESEGKYLKTTEKVLCVVSPRPGPAGLVFEIDSQKPEEGVLRFEPARNSVSHTVLLIDASNRNIVEEVEDAVSPVMFNEEDNVKLNNGWTYHIVVIAAGVNDQYTADAVLDYSVSWLDEADVPQSTDPSDDPTRMNPLCQVDDADITALLADCDADPVTSVMLTAPSGLMPSDATTDPGTLLVKVDWTPGAGAVGHLVMLFTSDWQGTPLVEGTPTGNSHTFSVDAGSYIAVVVAYDADGIQLAISGVTTVGGG